MLCHIRNSKFQLRHISMCYQRHWSLLQPAFLRIWGQVINLWWPYNCMQLWIWKDTVSNHHDISNFIWGRVGEILSCQQSKIIDVRVPLLPALDYKPRILGPKIEIEEFPFFSTFWFIFCLENMTGTLGDTDSLRSDPYWRFTVLDRSRNFHLLP